MANPFYVAPLGGENQTGRMLQGLSGLGSTLKEKREKDAAQERNMQMQEAWQSLQGSQNYEDYANFSIQYPEFAQQAQNSFGYANEQTRDAAKGAFIDVLTAETDQDALAALGSGIDNINTLGGNPQNLMEDYDSILMGEEGALDRLKKGIMLAEPDLMKSWQSMQGGGPDKKEVFSNIKDLRKAVRDADPDYVKVEDAYSRITASAEDPSAAGDLALIFNYMKMLDPGSTVREGEFATAQNAGGVDDAIMSAYNRVISGERLTEGQRSDFLGRSGKLFKNAKKLNKNRTSKIRKQANELGLDETLIFSEQIDVEPTQAPQEAVDFLKANPDARDQFQAKYGYLPEGY